MPNAPAIVLYQPEIPPNTGNIGRLCLSAGSRLHLVEPLGFKIDERSLRRAGLDYWQHLDVQTWPSLTHCRQSASPAATFYYLTTKASRPYWEIDFKPDDYLVFGPESRGLPEPLLAENAATAITIPMPGSTHARSLNLSSSAAIVLYEAIRQLQKNLPSPPGSP